MPFLQEPRLAAIAAVLIAPRAALLQVRVECISCRSRALAAIAAVFIAPRAALLQLRLECRSCRSRALAAIAAVLIAPHPKGVKGGAPVRLV